eukprot:TRINITY_DN2965_c0_g1_i4.p1 TRINITY_DN2965_c0_g1~~TRINITY_DN2965_c0_g1_i4.p1  ORF type:complete len:277 (-),score=47.05 TRINITY_DN2965_c0_g1_i4:164-994(-)
MDKTRKITWTDEERQARKQCFEEAFWYRAVPLGIVSSACALIAVRSGKIQTKSRIAACSIVLGFGTLGCMTGTLSYLNSGNCARLFEEKAPNGDFNKKGQEIKRKQKYNVELTNRFNKYFVTLQYSDLSDKEKYIYRECARCRFYEFSLPLALVFGGLSLYAQTKNFIPTSKIVTKFPKLPKTILGVVVGYLLGRMIYIANADCALRYIKNDPTGNIGAHLSQLPPPDIITPEEEGQVLEAMTSCQFETEEYILPGEEDSSKLIKQDLSNHLKEFM